MIMSTQAQKNQNNQATDPNRWVDEYGNYLFNYALGRLRNKTDAENAVQETFLAAFKNKDTFEGKSTERTWLISILKHKIIDHIRKAYKERPITDIKNDEQTIDQFFDQASHLDKIPGTWMPKTDELLNKNEFWDAFRECQKKLPQGAADAFMLREVEQLKGREVCEILNISESNLWVLLHRARLQLRACLEKNWFEKEN